MLTKKEIILLKPFVKEPWKSFTLSEIKAISKNKSHHYVYDSLDKFSREGILKVNKRGNTNLYSIDSNREGNINYLTLAEFMIKEERADLPYKNLFKIIEKIKSNFFSFLITGSYAEGKQKKTSDIDVIIIIPDSDSKKPCEIALKEGELMIPEVHGFVFTQEEFYLMLVNKEFNLGKEAVKKHIILYGAEAYYKILLGAIENGFKG